MLGCVCVFTEHMGEGRAAGEQILVCGLWCRDPGRRKFSPGAPHPVLRRSGGGHQGAADGGPAPWEPIGSQEVQQVVLRTRLGLNPGRATVSSSVWVDAF